MSHLTKLDTSHVEELLISESRWSFLKEMWVRTILHQTLQLGLVSFGEVCAVRRSVTSNCLFFTTCNEYSFISEFWLVMNYNTQVAPKCVLACVCSQLTCYMDLKRTGRFIMFSVITNIYNKKTKRPTLMELFTATGKLKSFFFLTTRNVRCVHHEWHGAHRYDSQRVWQQLEYYIDVFRVTRGAHIEHL